MGLLELQSYRRRLFRYPSVMGALVLTVILAPQLRAQRDWLTDVRQQVAAKDLRKAAQIIDARLKEEPNDLEAQAWRARILSWTGDLAEAEVQYRGVLQRTPNDVDVIIGLADVLLWQGKLAECSSLLDRAQGLEPLNREIEERRTRVRELTRKQASDVTEKGASSLGHELQRSDLYHYSLTIGTETDLFSYSSDAQLQSAALAIRWNSRLTSNFSANVYRRLRSSAEQLSSGIAYRFSANQSLAVSFGAAPHQQIAAIRQVSLDYDRGTRFHAGLLKGVELAGHSAGIWFDGSQVTVLGTSAVAYLPRDWWTTLVANTARTKFQGLSPAWTLSFAAKVSVPVRSRVRVEVGAGSGAENYSTIDQIGRISARTYTGGAHYSLGSAQEFSTFAAYQQRSHGLTQISIGGGYGLHF
jgi:tetratricopeptide (TPR) repeat protein